MAALAYLLIENRQLLFKKLLILLLLNLLLSLILNLAELVRLLLISTVEAHAFKGGLHHLRVTVLLW